ncbi:similar to Saccharomyces cerevisiae YKR079C TRZ1 tRNA 3'-end processing endonuclease tRNase Z [Maudiozyma barnettii]|uniref:ribonuclease Z n=1 Tax=Maudiozyma barnettii TaxID=61262 RepID=A0A8H2VIK3_9SACH|nr:similar to Saccharomyces cerevisiae YKR079C TRZ1 tRNA 3'-end processing endonuclease tRNase Z [Kazachstania barnettii]CAB4256033.1 similar to Saccharomyces cerevisiae YKR079C TRZ1 tRNA 3'-end processing endonuclease tRNase Z [Kazachstania barnettii]CAD1784641.1 similar to Saccharomyces cerevisiae YKR079C TRZ1 tRNA 3'-end processing endonuclease tRNase Z [Kazachstania barnettii]
MYTITTVTQPCADTKHPLLLLQTVHGDRYMFGKIGEGAQRAITENKIRLAKLENIFLTGKLDWSSTGGLAGLILTIADQGKNKIVLNYGNKLINYVISTWRYFVFRFGIKLQSNIMSSLNDNQIYKDPLINVKAFTVTPKISNEPVFNIAEDTVLNTIVANMFPKHAPTSKYDPTSDPHLNVELPRVNFEQSSTNYEISFNPIRGKFLVQEAIRLGVPKGPMFAALTKGTPVTLDNGTKVTPEQVLEKQRRFPKILILDIPDDSYIQSFEEQFSNYDAAHLGAIYYFLDDSVTINDQLIRFMESFTTSNKNIKHIVSHPNVSLNSLAFVGSAVTTLKLKALQMENYNLPRTNNLLSREFYDCFEKSVPEGTSMIQSQEDSIQTQLNKSNVHIMEKDTLITVDATPVDESTDNYKCQVSTEGTHMTDDAKVWRELYDSHIEPLNLPTVSYETLITNQKNQNNFNNSKEKADHVEIVTFGTGSALPSKYRNVISTLVKVPYIDESNNISQRNILFDAGENTIGQIKRNFSENKQQDIFKDLKMIYLSHLHADHHLGIISILREWYQYNKSDPDARIYLVSPWQYNKFVKEWLLLESPEILLRINYISCEHLINERVCRMETKPINVDEYVDLMNDEFGENESNSDGESAGELRSLKRRRLELNNMSSFRNIKMIRSMYEDLHIQRFQTCRAIHCNWAYSNSITFQVSNTKTFKVSYSGDTRPNIDNFAKDVGQNSDLLIHEATLDNELQEDAIKKKHCTINEAITVSNKMNAQKLLLTHFSQRYPKVPNIMNNVEIKAKEYCFAFDGMIVDYEKMGEQLAILPKLGNLFVEEAEEEIEKENVQLREHDDHKQSKKKSKK